RHLPDREHARHRLLDRREQARHHRDSWHGQVCRLLGRQHWRLHLQGPGLCAHVWPPRRRPAARHSSLLRPVRRARLHHHLCELQCAAVAGALDQRAHGRRAETQGRRHDRRPVHGAGRR
ncbi:hypothetical protein BN1708_017508, partial [Verticillium longisporum]